MAFFGTPRCTRRVRKIGYSATAILAFVAVFQFFVENNKKQPAVEHEQETNPDESKYLRATRTDDVISGGERIVRLAVVACSDAENGEDITNETVNMIKSALIFSPGVHLEVFVFTNNLEDVLKDKFSAFPPHYLTAVSFHFIQARYPDSYNRSEESLTWSSHPCASFRLFLPEVLSEIDSIIYVDTDVLFLDSIESLWNQLESFNSKQAVGLARRVGWRFRVPPTTWNYIEMEDGTMTQVNTGVFLMNLTRMREPSFKSYSSTPPNDHQETYTWNWDLLGPYRSKYQPIDDQHLVNIILHFNKDLIHFLPCKFNYQHKFCFDDSNDRICDSAIDEGASILHGSANTFYNNYAPAFKVIYQAILQFNLTRDTSEDLISKIHDDLFSPTIVQHQHCSNLREVIETRKD